ncbi:hypothetical protein CHKEEEPN_3477 [Methylorubrum podarium]|jgi:hypothetical protein|nr:hypothetical protein CHKEEEPN_3477 [Methylorubrum podarium]
MAGPVVSGAAVMPFGPAQNSIAPVAARPVKGAPVMQRPDRADDVVTDDGESTPNDRAAAPRAGPFSSARGSDWAQPWITSTIS